MKSCFHSLSRLFSEKPKQMCLFIGICVIFLALVLLFFGIFFFRNQAEEPASSPQTSESVLFPQTKEETASFENAPTTDSSPVFSPEPSINGETEQEKEPISPKALSHGIDVSKWQGVIDWAKVKESKTVDFAMIRVGYRAANGNIEKDEYADYNLQQAENSGILTGAYFYSGADSQKEALREAQWLLDAIAGYAISYPVVLDFEIGSAASHLTAKSRTDLALSFLREIQKAGYEAMLYARERILARVKPEE